MTVEIEVARPADAEALAALHFLSHTVSFAPFASEDWLANRDLTDYVEQWRESLELAESDERACAWKAVSGGEIVGTVKVSPETSHEAQLGNMHVHPNFHRRGIGSALMSAAVRFMVSAGFSIAILGVIQANAAARAIYEKHGWTARLRAEEFWCHGQHGSEALANSADA